MNLQHLTATTHLWARLKTTQQVLKLAGMLMGFSFSHTSIESLNAATAIVGKSTLVDALVAALGAKQLTTASLVLPSTADIAPAKEKDGQATVLRIDIRTCISDRTYGTEYVLSLPPSLQQAMFPPVTDAMGQIQSQSSKTHSTFSFTNLEDLTGYIDTLLSVSLAHDVIGKSMDGWEPHSQMPELSKTMTGGGKRGRRKKVGVQISNGEIELWWAWLNEARRGAEQFWTEKSEGGPSFMDVVALYTQP